MSAGPSVIVAGAGVFGAAIALELARDGARVVLADPAETGDNASGVAAGMIAPAFDRMLYSNENARRVLEAVFLAESR